MLWLCGLLSASCAGDKNPPPAPTHKPFSQRLNESNGFKVDDEGNWSPKTNKRSPFESQGQSPYFKGEYGKKTYKTGEYSKKSWWGNKDYGRQSYAGNTDGSRFQTTSRLDGKGAREAGTQAAAGNRDPYRTGAYATTNAREAGANAIDKPSDAETDVRRRVFPQPEIFDWQQQRAITLEQSRGILGR